MAIPIPIAGIIISGANIVVATSPATPNPDNTVAPSAMPSAATKDSVSNTPNVSAPNDSPTNASVYGIA